MLTGMCYEAAGRWMEAIPTLGVENLSLMPIPGKDGATPCFGCQMVCPKASKNGDLVCQFIKEGVYGEYSQTNAFLKYGKMSVIAKYFDEALATTPLWKNISVSMGIARTHNQRAIIDSSSFSRTAARPNKQGMTSKRMMEKINPSTKIPSIIKNPLQKKPSAKSRRRWLKPVVHRLLGDLFAILDQDSRHIKILLVDSIPKLLRSIKIKPEFEILRIGEIDGSDILRGSAFQCFLYSFSGGEADAIVVEAPSNQEIQPVDATGICAEQRFSRLVADIIHRRKGRNDRVVRCDVDRIDTIDDGLGCHFHFAGVADGHRNEFQTEFLTCGAVLLVECGWS